MSGIGGETGGCLCGAVRYVISAEPLMQAVCHCKNCQRQAGSGWSMIVGLPADGVAIEGEVRTYEDRGSSGAAVHRQFCPVCGSPVFTRIPDRPEMIFIKAGSLDDTSGFSPQVQFWTDSKQAWIDLPGIPGLPGNPG